VNLVYLISVDEYAEQTRNGISLDALVKLKPK